MNVGFVEETMGEKKNKSFDLLETVQKKFDDAKSTLQKTIDEVKDIIQKNLSENLTKIKEVKAYLDKFKDNDYVRLAVSIREDLEGRFGVGIDKILNAFSIASTLDTKEINSKIDELSKEISKLKKELRDKKEDKKEVKEIKEEKKEDKKERKAKKTDETVDANIEK